MELLENFFYSYYIKSITYYKLYFHYQTKINKIIDNIYLGDIFLIAFENTSADK